MKHMKPAAELESTVIRREGVLSKPASSVTDDESVAHEPTMNSGSNGSGGVGSTGGFGHSAGNSGANTTDSSCGDSGSSGTKVGQTTNLIARLNSRTILRWTQGVPVRSLGTPVTSQKAGLSTAMMG